MKKIVTSILAVLIITTFVSLAANAQDAKGKEEKKLDAKMIFTEKKCSGCHSIEAAGITKKNSSAKKDGPPDLSAVGSELKADFIIKFLQKNETLHNKKHMIKFNGSDEELAAVAQWLASMKGDAKKEKK